MKKSFLPLLSASLIFTGLQAQSKLPQQVMQSFQTRYPHAENISLKDKQSCYRAEFALNGSKMIANFRSTGELINTERIIYFEDLPSEVQHQFNKSKYKTWTKVMVKESQHYGEPLNYFLIVLKGNSEKKILTYDANGKLLNEENL